MILLDTDHLTALKYPEHPRARQLANRLSALPPDEIVGLSIISIEEQLRGWLAAIAKQRESGQRVKAYRELERLFQYFQSFEIVSFDEPCDNRFEALQAGKLRVGTMDLKIAATALVHDALLLSANLRDFERVPSLRIPQQQLARVLGLDQLRITPTVGNTHPNA